MAVTCSRRPSGRLEVEIMPSISLAGAAPATCNACCVPSS
ncbi:Uncharacterised protein [Bordetella pertussis]|nr:Uncharacterised protein [Bordetella pertussis]